MELLWSFTESSIWMHLVYIWSFYNHWWYWCCGSSFFL